MSEEMFIGDYAPKRIWVDEHSEWWPTHSRSDTTPYIRADIVDELVEALKMGTYEPYCVCEKCEEVRVVIEKLEESHE